MDTGILGRGGELAQIDAFLTQDGPRALVLEGEAGIGKTTLWRAGVELARERGYRVLTSRPSGPETQLSFAALRDVLDPSFGEAAAALPAPQRHALAVALLREEPGLEPPPQGAVAASVVSVLHHLAHKAPLLVAVDDVQWLDAPSAALLEFAARRVGESRIGFLVARRLNGNVGSPLALDRAYEERLGVVFVGPLSLGALHRLLRVRLGAALSRPLLRRIHDASGGNPFFALELAKALEERGMNDAENRLPLPATVHELLGDRLTSLPETTRDALLFVAAASQPTHDLLDAVLGAEVETFLEPAFTSGILEPSQVAIQFAHPLFASAVYDAASATSRRRAHERLAAASSDFEERARHLALAATGPDDKIAALLDNAGRAARSRGAPAAAAELLGHAIELTAPADVDARAVRTIDAAAALMITGDRAKARSLLEAAVAILGPGPIRSDALIFLSDLVADDPEGADSQLTLIEQSLREAGTDRRRRTEALLRRDMWERHQNRFEEALEVVRSAVALAEQADDEYLLARALTRKADLEILLGLAEDPPAHFRRARELDARLHIDPHLGPGAMLAVCLVRAGRVDEARPLLLTQHRRALDEGNEVGRSMLCLFLAELEWLAGQWANAEEWAGDGIELAEQCGARAEYGALLSILALIEASHGEADAARAHATEGLELCEAIRDQSYALQNRYVLGFLELSLGNAKGAHEQLSRYTVERGIEGTKRISFVANAIEALVQLGELQTASELVEELERRGHTVHRPSLLALSGRCRGLVLGARGDPQGAVEPLEEAIELFAKLNLPFEGARTLLVLGEVQRRAKRKRAARETLENAFAIFEELSAPLWAQKARAELARVGGRRPAGAVLTETERRIAELVAEGRSNKEVSATLYVSVKTVEANLSRIYAKLGVRSRTELAHLIANAGSPTEL